MLGQFPNQVLWATPIWLGSYSNRTVFCGGSIYNTSTIITAAHCCIWFENQGQLLEYTSIIAGRINLDDTVNGQKKNYQKLHNPS